MAVLQRHLMLGQLYQIRAQTVFVAVYLTFLPFYFLHVFFFITIQQGNRLLQRSRGQVRHPGRRLAAVLHRESRRIQKAVVQSEKLLLPSSSFRSSPARSPHGKLGQLHQEAVEGQPQTGGEYVKRRVYHRDAGRIGRVVQERKMHERIHGIKQDQEDNGPIRLKYRCTKAARLAFFFAPMADRKRRHAGTDVLAHDNGKRRSVGYGSGHAQSLQNSPRSGGALNNGRENRACTIRISIGTSGRDS